MYSRVERGSDGEIPMDVVGSVRMAPEAHALAFCIDAVTRSFVLRAETRDELNAWVFAYHKVSRQTGGIVSCLTRGHRRRCWCWIC